MSDCTRWSFQRKVDWFRCQFAQHTSLPFAEVLPAQVIASAMETMCLHGYDSLYNPVTVLWLFLSQVIHANPTLAATVENFLAWRLGQGMSACSTDTGAYARARQRLPGSPAAGSARASRSPRASAHVVTSRTPRTPRPTPPRDPQSASAPSAGQRPALPGRPRQRSGRTGSCTPLATR